MMFTLVWSDEAFERMGQIVRNNPARTPELGAALREMFDQLSRHPLEAGEPVGTIGGSCSPARSPSTTGSMWSTKSSRSHRSGWCAERPRGDADRRPGAAAFAAW